MTTRRDVYDSLPPARAAELRRANKERLAVLEAAGAARRARLAALRSLSTVPTTERLSPRDPTRVRSASATRIRRRES